MAGLPVTKSFPACTPLAGIAGSPLLLNEFVRPGVAASSSAVPILHHSEVLITKSCEQIKKEDYDLPTLTPKLLAFGKEVSLGRGFQLVR